MQEIEVILLGEAKFGAHLGPHSGRQLGRPEIAQLVAQRRFVAQRGMVGQRQSRPQCDARSGVKKQHRPATMRYKMIAGSWFILNQTNDYGASGKPCQMAPSKLISPLTPTLPWPRSCPRLYCRRRARQAKRVHQRPPATRKHRKHRTHRTHRPSRGPAASCRHRRCRHVKNGQPAPATS